MDKVEMVGSFLTLGAVCLPVVFLFLSCAVASAQPRTLYKRKDIQNARENIKRYSWAQGMVEGWKHSVAFSMQQGREVLEEIVPEFSATTHYNLTCPACVGKQSRMGRGRFGWGGPIAPDRLTCNDCGTVYPNPEYPETGVLELPRMGQTPTYYEMPEERAVWILDRFVQVFPNYLWRTYRNYFVDLPPAEVTANLGEHGGGGRLPRLSDRHRS